MKECERIIATIEHFYGHMEIECCDRLGLCWWKKNPMSIIRTH